MASAVATSQTLNRMSGSPLPVKTVKRLSVLLLRFGAGRPDRSQRASLQGQTLDATGTLDRFHLLSGRSPCAPNCSRRSAVDFGKDGVEPA